MERYLERLGPEEIRRHVERSHGLWGGGLTPEERLAALLRRMETAGPERLVMSGLAGPDGTLKASLKRYHFNLRVEGASAACVGLGAIFTDPEHRNRGLAGRLIEMVLAESARSRGCRAAVLYSDINPGYYRRFGFRESPARSWRAATATLPAAGPLSVRTAGPRDIESLLRWHARATDHLPLRTDRTAESWKSFREINQAGPDLVVSDGAAEVGFLTTTRCPQEGRLWIEEACVPDALTDRLWATARRLAQESGFKEVGGWDLPCQAPPQAAAVSPRPGAIPMVAALDPALTVSDADLAGAYFAPTDHF